MFIFNTWECPGIELFKKFMKELFGVILFSIGGLIGISQDSIYYNQDSTLIYLPITFDSIVMSNGFIPTRCKNDLSDSLSALSNSFHSELPVTTFDTTINYTYQFTKTIDMELDFQLKLRKNHKCFLIEDKKNIMEYVNHEKFVFYNDNEWLVVFIDGIPHIGNSTYITDSHLFFKKD